MRKRCRSLWASASASAKRAEAARRIVDEALLVQGADLPRLEVGHAARRIVNLGGQDVEADGVDGEVAAIEIVDQLSGRDRRQRAGAAVLLAARRGHVD